MNVLEATAQWGISIEMKMMEYLHNEILIAVKMKGLGLYLAAQYNAYFKFQRDIYDRQMLKRFF